MTSDSVWQVVRYLLIGLGGIGISKGWYTADELTGAVAAIGTLFVMGWGIYVKFGTKATTAAAAEKPSVPVVSPATGITK